LRATETFASLTQKLNVFVTEWEEAYRTMPICALSEKIPRNRDLARLFCELRGYVGLADHTKYLAMKIRVLWIWELCWKSGVS
jgi:hypothetical protein